MSDIFMTYAREDRAKAAVLADRLEREGLSVWWDRKIRPGYPFDREIEAALGDARCVVVLWSRASVSSDWVRAEAAEARGRGILVPVLLEEVKIPLEFARLQAVDLIDWQAEVPEASFTDLRTSVSQILEQPIAEKKKPSPAVTPGALLPTGQRANRSRSKRTWWIFGALMVVLVVAAVLTSRDHLAEWRPWRAHLLDQLQEGYFVIGFAAYSRESALAAASGSVAEAGTNPLVVDSAHWSNLAPGWYIVVYGSYETSEEAEAAAERLKPNVPDIYVKYSGSHLR